jgi:hypothetical protein
MRVLDGRCRWRAGLPFGPLASLLVVATIGLPRSSAQEGAPKPAVPAAKADELRKKADDGPEATMMVSGIVRDRGGDAVPDVAITGSDRTREVRFTNGKLQDFARHDWLFVTSDSEGRYRFDGASMRRANPPIGRYGVFAYHAKGYARKSAAELEFSGDLTLEPWGRVVGTVTVLGKPLANQPLRFTLDATDEHSMFYDYYEYEAKTDDRGRFVVEHVPAGVAHVSTGTSHGKEPGPFGIVSSPRKLIRAGETLTLNIGGTGRPVEGKLRVPEGLAGKLGGRMVLKTDARPEPPGLSAERMKAMGQEEIFLHYFNGYRSPAGLAHRLSVRIYSLQIQDGTFRAVEVEPGTYTLSFWIGEDFQHPIEIRDVVVPLVFEGRTDIPLDLGTIEITPPAPKR